MTLRETMQQHQALALKGDPAACREPIGGITVQSGGMRTEGTFGRHVVIVDEPKVFGGDDTAANPAEVLLAALATSVSVTLRCNAALQGVKVGRIQVDVQGDLDIRGFFDTDPKVRSGFQSISLEIQVESDATPEQLQRVLAATERGCPMLDTCRDATPIKIGLSR
jgi:uncharacterized OsmC-like protein